MSPAPVDISTSTTLSPPQLPKCNIQSLHHKHHDAPTLPQQRFPQRGPPVTKPHQQPNSLMPTKHLLTAEEGPVSLIGVTADPLEPPPSLIQTHTVLVDRVQ